MPETVEQLKWNIRLSLTVPPASVNLLPIGRSGIFRINEKMIMFFYLTRPNLRNPNSEPLTVVVPIVYDIKNNQTSIPHKENINSPVMLAAQQILVNLGQTGALNTGRCTILPSLQEILMNLTLPNEAPPVMMHQMNRPMGPGMGPAGPQMGPGGPRMMMMPPQQQRMMMQQQQQQQHGYMG